MDSGVGSLDKQAKPSKEEEEEVKVFVTQMLMSRVFFGNFQERRYVELLKSYRDVIVIDQQHGDLVRDLDIVKNRLDRYYKGKVWIGITGPNVVGAPSGHCVWIKLQDQPLGQYWFIINKVKFLPNEVIIKLKKIRMPSDASKPSDQGVKNDDGLSEVIDFLSNISLKSTMDIFTKQFLPGLLSILTYHNMKQTVLFLSVLLLTIVTGFLNGVQFAADFSIRFLKEFNGFIHAITPFLLGVLDLIAKVIGGAYILIAMMWRGKSGPPIAPQNFRLDEAQKSQLYLPPSTSQFKTYADFRQRYQNHDRHWQSAYSRQMK